MGPQVSLDQQNSEHLVMWGPRDAMAHQIAATIDEAYLYWIEG